MKIIHLNQAPSPPHIYIPQAPEHYNVEFPSLSGIWCGNKQFLKFIRDSLDRTNYSFSNQEWTYEQRREAQQILPFLYLGPSAAARDVKFLKRENITLLLVIRNGAMARANLLDGTKIAHQLGIKSGTIDIHGPTDLIPAFPHAIRAINDHVISIFQESNGSRIGKVLVFCESGNERSAVVVAAYLMAICGLDLTSSIHRIQTRRFCISLDERLKNLLLNYMCILNAKKDVTRVESQTSNPALDSNYAAKRRRNEGTDKEEHSFDMDVCSDDERFTGRINLAPFR